MKTSRVHVWICASAAALLVVLMTAALNSPLAHYDQPHCRGGQIQCQPVTPAISKLFP